MIQEIGTEQRLRIAGQRSEMECSKRIHPSRSNRIITQAIIFLALVSTCEGQRGDICACTPSVYEWTFNTAINCNDNQFDTAGIEDSLCEITAIEDGVTDLVPVEVSIIDITEFNQINQVLQQTIFEGQYVEGDEFSHISAISNPDEITEESIPKWIQMIMIGQNAAGNPLSMRWILRFTNSCTQYPVLSEGDQIAWTVFVSRKENDCDAILTME